VLVIEVISNGDEPGLFDNGEIFSLQSATSVADQPRRRWEVSVTSAAAITLSCATQEACLELIDGQADTSLAVGTRMEVIELKTSAGNTVVFIAPTGDTNSALSAAAEALLASLLFRRFFGSSSPVPAYCR